MQKKKEGKWGYMCQGLSAAAVVVSMKAAET